jgi:hypothetical protein
MPNKQKGEGEQDYVSRAIPILKKEGLSDKAAQGKAYGMYRSQTEKNEACNVKVYRHNKKLYKYSAKKIKGFESPEPGDLSDKDADLLAKVYADYRSKGMSKEESAKRAWGTVNKGS